MQEGEGTNGGRKNERSLESMPVMFSSREEMAKVCLDVSQVGCWAIPIPSSATRRQSRLETPGEFGPSRKGKEFQCTLTTDTGLHVSFGHLKEQNRLWWPLRALSENEETGRGGQN